MEAAALRRRAWSNAGPAASQALAELGAYLVDLLRARAGTSVSGYVALRDEIDPSALITFLHQQNFRIALPQTMPGPNLAFKEWLPGTPLVRGKFGLQEPGVDWPEVVPDVVLVPLLAFDRVGNRLGYGAGYYDAALRRLRLEGSIIAAGLAFDEQELPAIPREPQDERLDMILTPSRIIAWGD